MAPVSLPVDNGHRRRAGEREVSRFPGSPHRTCRPDHAVFWFPETIGTRAGESMRNDECIIRFLNREGKVLQTFQRDRDGWFQTSSKGIVRRCTAEQTLSHLLPPLAGVSRAIVSVERIANRD